MRSSHHMKYVYFTSSISEKTKYLLDVDSESAHPQNASVAVVWIAVIILAQSAHFPTWGEERKMCPQWQTNHVMESRWSIWNASCFETTLKSFKKKKKEEFAYGLCRPFGISSLPAAWRTNHSFFPAFSRQYYKGDHWLFRRQMPKAYQIREGELHKLLNC